MKYVFYCRSCRLKKISTNKKIADRELCRPCYSRIKRDRKKVKRKHESQQGLL